jgi:hypothetical protein
VPIVNRRTQGVGGHSNLTSATRVPISDPPAREMAHPPQTGGDPAVQDAADPVIHRSSRTPDSCAFCAGKTRAAAPIKGIQCSVQMGCGAFGSVASE